MSELTDQMREHVLKLHNAARAENGLSPLVVRAGECDLGHADPWRQWDPQLVPSALESLGAANCFEKCAWFLCFAYTALTCVGAGPAHPLEAKLKEQKYGENLGRWPLYPGLTDLMFINNIFATWMSTPKRIASHYTQIVWPTTTSIGCAYMTGCGSYPGSNWPTTAYISCVFSPAGNVMDPAGKLLWPDGRVASVRAPRLQGASALSVAYALTNRRSGTTTA